MSHINQSQCVDLFKFLILKSKQFLKILLFKRQLEIELPGYLIIFKELLLKV